MVWFFLAGFISGVIGTLLLGKFASERFDDDGIHRQSEDR